MNRPRGFGSGVGVMALSIACVIAFGGIALVGGCAAGRGGCDCRQTEECPVCKYNGDLGCVCVRVDGATPRSERNGRTYYFCSTDCKAAFDREPRKYVNR